MSIQVDKRTLEIAIKYDETRQEINKVTAELSEQNKVLQQLQKEKKAAEKRHRKNPEAQELKEINEKYEQQKQKIEQLEKKKANLRRSLGVEGLSLRELRSELQSYNNQLENLTPGTKAFNETKAHVDDLKNRIKELRTQTRQMAEDSKSSLMKFMEGFNQIGFAINNLFTIKDRIMSVGKGFYDWLAPMGEIAQQAEGIELAFQRIDKAGMLEHLRRETHETIDDLQLMQQAVKFKDFNLPLSQMGTYLAFAQQKAKDTGESLDYMVDSIVTGLGRQSPRILDNLGLSAKQIKDEVKKTGDFFGAVDKVIKEKMSEAGDYIETSSDRAAMAAARLKNAQLQLGKAWLPVKESIDSTFIDLQIRLVEAAKWMLENKAAVYALAVGLSAYTLAVVAFTVKQKLANLEVAEFNALMKKNLIGLAAAGLAAAVTWLISYTRETKAAAQATDELQQMENEAAKSAVNETSRLRKLYETTQDQNRSMNDRLSAVMQLKQEYPAYFGQLSNEAILAGQAAGQYRQLAKDILSAAKARAYGDKITEIEGKNIDLQATVDNGKRWREANKARYQEILQRRNEGKGYTWGEAKFMREYEKVSKERSDALGQLRLNGLAMRRLADKQAEYTEGANRLAKNTQTVETGLSDPSGGSKNDPYDNDIKNLEKTQRERLIILKQSLQNGEITEEEYRRRSKQLDMQNLAEKLALQEKYGKDTTDTQNAILDKQIAAANESYQEQQKQMNGELSALQDAHNADMAGLAKMRLDGMITDEEEYHQRELEAEIDFQLQRIAIIKKYGGDTAQAEAELVNIRLKQQSAEKREAQEAYEKELREYAKSHTATETNAHAADVNQAEYDAGLISFKEYQDRKTEILEESEQIRHDIRQQFVNQANELLQSAQSYFNAMQSREESRVDAKYKKLIAAAKKQGKDTTKLEEQQEAEKAAIKKKYALKEFRMNVLKILADTATGIAALWKNPGPPWAIPLTALVAAQGAMQLATAKAQQEQAAGLYGGGFSEDAEGFTADGNPKDVAGMIPVHKREFVINHKALQNPAVMEVAKTIDSYQKAGRPDMINSTALLRAAAMGGGLADGGFSQSTGSSTSSAAALGLTAEQSRVLEDCREYLRIISEDRGVTIRDVRRKIREEELMETRASR